MNAVPHLYDETKPKERQSYRLGAVIQSMRDDARDTDENLEAAIMEIYVALEDGKITEAEAYKILRPLIFAFKTHNNHLNALNLLDESGSEPALREVERNAAKKRKAAR